MILLVGVSYCTVILTNEGHISVTELWYRKVRSLINMNVIERSWDQRD